MVRKSDTIPPLLQSAPLARSAQQQRSQEVVTLSNVLVQHGQHQRLLVQIVGPRLELELLVENRI